MNMNGEQFVCKCPSCGTDDFVTFFREILPPHAKVHAKQIFPNECVQKAFASKSQGNQICCPCESCRYRFWRHEGVVRDHLICNGFVPRTDKLSELGINFQREQTVLDNEEGSTPNDFIDDIVELLHDAHDAFRKGPNDEAKKFFKLVEEGQEELFPGCKNHSKLSFMIHLFILKCDQKLTNVAFGDILELIREVLPDAKLPASFNEAKVF
uniref:Transposase-associated domain-containing protein n=1 Tax=Chenopodium quinoa TaxID=63459 RepID=A0A803N8S5_CHEQI